MKRTVKISLIFVFTLLCMLATTVGLVTVSANKTVLAEGNALIYMTEGASIKVDNFEESGIRFQANINKNQYDILKETYGDKLSVGMIIVPTDYVVKASGTTFNDLSKLGVNIGYQEAESLITKGSIYQFNVRLYQIKDANYARKFSAIAYVKIDSKDEIAGYTPYENAQYMYSEYQEDLNARSIYDVAKVAIGKVSSGELNFSQTNIDVTKSYLNSVLDLVNNDGTVSFASVDGYKTPFALEKLSEKDYVIKGSAKAMLYNGERIKDFNVVDKDMRFYNVVGSSKDGQSTATFGENNNSVTLKGVSYTESYSYKSVASKIDNSYIGFDGNYGVGTYLDFYFTGNNMPTVMFFADSFNGNMTNYDAEGNVLNQKGVIVTPGFASGNANAENAAQNGNAHRFTVYGPNRLEFSANGGQTKATSADDHTTSLAISYAYLSRVNHNQTPVEMFRQGTANYKGLSHSDYANVKFRYTIGTEDVGGVLYVNAYMYQVTEEGETLLGQQRINAKVNTSNLTTGKIVVYAGIKADGTDTTFTYSMPYRIKTSGATFNEDGSVTLSAVTNNANPSFLIMAKKEFTYVGYEGNYGVGARMDFYFTGNNMPNVMFFADKINGNLTNYDSTGAALNQKGVLVSPGISSVNTAQQSNGNVNRFAVYGPNRLSADLTYATNAGSTALTTSSMCVLAYLARQQANSTNGYDMFVQGITGNATNTGLSHDKYANTNFKYTVWTEENASGYLVVKAEMYNADSSEKLGWITLTTKVPVSMLTAGSIVAYASVKADSSATTFTCSKPYFN